MLTAVVPVKTQSERLPNKNLRKFADTTLFELKLSQLRDTDFDMIVISSESPRVLEIAEKAGFDTHLRDPEYSTSTVPMSEVFKYIASEMHGDDIAWCNITNPLAGSEVYNEAIKKYKSMVGYDSLLSVYNLQKYLWYKGNPVNFTPYPHPRSQDLRGVYAQNFVVNMCPREAMVERGTAVGERPYFFEIGWLESTKIDYQEHFDFCEMIYKRGK